MLLSPWEDRSVVDDPYPFYARLRDEAPVWQVPGTRTHYVAPWALVADAVARPDDFSSNLTAVLIEGEDGLPTELDMTPLGPAINVLATGDEPAHGPARKLVAPHFTLRRLAVLEQSLGAVMDRLWAECAASPAAVDWMSLVGDRLPMTLVARVIGLPDDDVDDVIGLSYESASVMSGLMPLSRFEPAATSAARLNAYLMEHLERALTHPGDDLLGAYAERVSAGEMDAGDVVGALVILVGAGGESTAGLIGNAVRLLAERRDLQDRLRADIDLLPRFLEEVLRFESPFRGHYRHVRRDSVLGDAKLAGGDHLFLLWGSANRDPSQFDQPDEVLLDRKLSSNHFAFGRGLHFCLGAPLARLEARCAVGTLLTRTTSFRLVPDVPPSWQPSVAVRRHSSLHLQLDLA